jgi:hypothetical protein
MANDDGVRRRISRLGRSAWLLTMVVWATASLADDKAPPIVTAKNASQHAEKPGMVELSVVEVKFAQRRQMHFLSATANFRSEDNLPVAIRAADFGRFQQAGIKDLSARYLGHKIRARGTIARDEGQWLLMVTSPDQIALVDAPAKPAVPAELVVVDESGRRTGIALPLAGGLPRSKVTVEHEGAQETYEGVALAAILEKAGVQLGVEARGKLLGGYLVARAQDDYAAVFSVAEVDPFYAEQPAIIADRLNGEPLPESKGSLQIVVPSDKHRRRWVYQLQRIEVRNGLDMPGASTR